ncbi:hypothetical protein PR048_032631 [Dryococelus australis]|uniref:YqaJ viral recombinase domain-containing protein n=1 Tax=Dryococelus australis TaxID=614101 RepID=A0ABQ9G2R7_9NEOP|nr:hypothetical protein PR048_032631 [Dryococelus australis]
MEKAGLLKELLFYVQRVANNARSLILHVDKNMAENYNSVVAKFVRGKRINFSLANSYKTRCEAAVVSVNSELSTSHLLKKSPGVLTKTFIGRRKKMAEELRRRRLIFPGRERVEHRDKKNLDSDYGPNASLSTPGMSKSTSSHEWKVDRSKRITSSFLGKIFKMKTTISCANVEIRYQVFKGNSGTNWGIEKEFVAIAQFERENPGIVVKRSGLIVNEECPFLGASPDGLISDDQIIEYLEIKDGKPQLKLSHNYMYQVQGVLHISRRKTCNFVVRTPEGMVYLKIQRDKDFWENKMITKLLTFFYDSLFFQKLLTLDIP